MSNKIQDLLEVFLLVFIGLRGIQHLECKFIAKLSTTSFENSWFFRLTWKKLKYKNGIKKCPNLKYWLQIPGFVFRCGISWSWWCWAVVLMLLGVVSLVFMGLVVVVDKSLWLNQGRCLIFLIPFSWKKM